MACPCALIDELIAAIDTNRDGVINLDEWILFLNKQYQEMHLWPLINKKYDGEIVSNDGKTATNGRTATSRAGRKHKKLYDKFGT